VAASVAALAPPPSGVILTTAAALRAAPAMSTTGRTGARSNFAICAVEARSSCQLLRNDDVGQ